MTEIKAECEKLYKKIKEASERLDEIRKGCEHKNKIEAIYSYRVGHYTDAIVCDDCGACIGLNPVK